MPCESLLSKEVPTLVDSTASVQKLLNHINKLNMCVGHPETHFVEMVEARKGRLLSAAGSVAAVTDRSAAISFQGHRYSATVRTI